MISALDLQGHRGARGLFPENTLDGFARAAALGVTTIELDVAVTADGVAVVSHDPVLDPDLTRGPDGAWIASPGAPINRLTYAELQGFDVGRVRPDSATARAHPFQVPQDGARIPRLVEALAVGRRLGVRIDAELKTLPDRAGLAATPETMARLVLAAIDDAGAGRVAAARSFDWRGLRALRTLRPALPLTWLTSATTVAASPLWWGRQPAGSVPRTIAEESAGARYRPAWAPAYETLTRAALDEAHHLGLAVVPWTVNEPDDIARLLAWGVDGICTDRPDLVMAVCGR